MYAIRYRKTNTGNEYVRIISSWAEALDVWAQLLAEPDIRIVPVPETGLDIELLSHAGNVADLPPAFRMVAAG